MLYLSSPRRSISESQPASVCCPVSPHWWTLLFPNHPECKFGERCPSTHTPKTPTMLKTEINLFIFLSITFPSYLSSSSFSSCYPWSAHILSKDVTALFAPPHASFLFVFLCNICKCYDIMTKGRKEECWILSVGIIFHVKTREHLCSCPLHSRGRLFFPISPLFSPSKVSPFSRLLTKVFKAAFTCLIKKKNSFWVYRVQTLQA